MRVQEILRSKPRRLVKISRNASLRDASQLLSSEQVGMVLVVDAAGRLAGALSERDVIGFIARNGPDAVNHDVGSAMAEITIAAAPEDAVTDVMRIMTEQRARHLPVIAGAMLVGVISIGDILKSRLAEKDQETAVLRDLARASLANAA